MRDSTVYQSLLDKDNKMEEELRQANPNLKTVKDFEPLGAFVVFEETGDKIRCINAYEKYNKRCGCCYTVSDNHKMRGEYEIKVTKGVEPSNIRWENLEVKCCESCCRTFLVIVVVILLLLFSFSAIYAVKIYQTNLPSLTNCSD